MKRSGYTFFKLLRIGAAALVLTLFYVSLVVTGPLYDSLLRILTRVQLFPSLINVLLSGGGWLAAGFVPVALLTILAGRIYCSVVCPLGILQDIFIFISGKKRHRKYSRRSSMAWLHGSITVASIGGLLIGVPVLFGLLEPFAFWGRLYRDMVLPAGAQLSQAIVLLLKEFDVFWAPLPFRGEVGAVFLTIVSGGALAVLTYKYGRWYCNALCPTGAVLRVLSLRPLAGIDFDHDSCTKCGVCAHVCPAGCIDVSDQHVAHNRCIMCMECTVRCPFDAIDFKILSRPGTQPKLISTKHDKETRRPGTVNHGRRKAVMVTAGAGVAAVTGGIGISAGGFLRNRLAVKRSSSGTATTSERAGRAVIPPGAGNVRRFTARCISCHTCVSVCPTHVLQPSFFALGVSGFLQPVMDYHTAYCEWECNRCSQICPTGAIGPVTITQKKRIQMGTVQFDEDRCVVFTDGTDCGACAEVCPTQAVRMIPYKNGLTQPFTEPEICSGCGSCEYACPVSLPKAITVTPHTNHQVRSERKPQQEAPEEDVPEEFPF